MATKTEWHGSKWAAKLDTARDIVRAFLALDITTLPGATLIDSEDCGDAHGALRELAAGRYPHVDVGFADKIRLRADADGWRDGVVLDVGL